MVNKDVYTDIYMHSPTNCATCFLCITPIHRAVPWHCPVTHKAQFFHVVTRRMAVVFLHKTRI